MMTTKDEQQRMAPLQVIRRVRSKLQMRYPSMVTDRMVELMAKYIPQWEEQISKHDTLGLATGEVVRKADGTILNIGHHACCIVGEMHGFRSSYEDKDECVCGQCMRNREAGTWIPYCSECNRFASDLVTNDVDEFYPELSRALEHFDAEHGAKI